MKFFKDILNEISKEELENYYIKENHSFANCLDYWKLSNSLFLRLLKYYGIKKDTKKHQELITKTKIEKYGSASYNNRVKAEQTCIQKYGVKNPFQDKENIKKSYISKLGVEHPMQLDSIKEKVILNHDYKKSIAKSQQTYFKKTGYSNPSKNPACIKKGLETKIKNGDFDSPGTSGIERRLEKILNRKFIKVISHYRDKRYARASGYMFECDFYIEELDLFIELNAHWSHGDCPFDPLNSEHQQLATKLQNSLKPWEQDKYKNWCIRDLEKQTIAIKNNINYLMLYPTNSIFNNQKFNNKNYADLIEYLLKKLNNKK